MDKTEINILGYHTIKVTTIVIKMVNMALASSWMKTFKVGKELHIALELIQLVARPININTIQVYVSTADKIDLPLITHQHSCTKTDDDSRRFQS